MPLTCEPSAGSVFRELLAASSGPVFCSAAQKNDRVRVHQLQPNRAALRRMERGLQPEGHVQHLETNGRPEAMIRGARADGTIGRKPRVQS